MKILETETEYQAGLKRLEEIFFAEENTPEGDEAEALVLALEAYEHEHYPIANEITQIEASRNEIAEGKCKPHEQVMEDAKVFILRELHEFP
jgi:antitoxin component HigA of HigAB toxin-antitoxin module